MTPSAKCLVWLFLVNTGTSVASDRVSLTGSEFDFGNVPQNATLVHEVWLRAGSEDSIRLVDIKTGCGCLTAPWEKTSLAPKDSLRLAFYWQTRGSEGRRDLSAYLFVEPEAYPLEIRLKGKVVTQSEPEASIEMTPSRMPFGGRRGRNENTLALKNRSTGDLKLALASVGPGIEVDLPESVRAGESVNVKVTKVEADTISSLETSFTIEATGNPGPKQTVSIPVTFGDFSFRPNFTTTRR